MFKKKKEEWGIDKFECPFLGAGMPCREKLCKLWNEQEKDCNLNVLVKELKRLK